MIIRSLSPAASACLAALACFVLSGCSSSAPPAPAKPAAAHDHDHGHDHDGHDHDHPETFAAGIAELASQATLVKNHLAAGKTEAADDVVHAVGHLIEDVQGLLSKEKLGEKATAAASQALEDLFDCFDKLDTALHAPEGKSPPPAEVHAGLAERIDAALTTLRGTLKP